MLINKIISLLKNDTFTDDNNDSNEESKEKYKYLKLKKRNISYFKNILMASCIY